MKYDAFDELDVLEAIVAQDRAVEAGPDGTYPEGTVNFLVQRRLREPAEQAKNFRGNGEPSGSRPDSAGASHAWRCWWLRMARSRSIFRKAGHEASQKEYSRSLASLHSQLPVVGFSFSIGTNSSGLHRHGVSHQEKDRGTSAGVTTGRRATSRSPSRATRMPTCWPLPTGARWPA